MVEYAKSESWEFMQEEYSYEVLEVWYGDPMHVILNGEPLEEVDCFKYSWSRKRQLMEDVKGMWYTE